MKKISQDVASLYVQNPEPLNHDVDYASFLVGVKKTFTERTKVQQPLYTTNSIDLFNSIFLTSMPAEYQQVHRCNSCRRFFETYGNLVTIDDNGKAQSVFWHENNVPHFYKAGVKRMREFVEKAGVTGVFFTEESKWGTEKTKDGLKVWNHIAVVPPSTHVYHNALMNAFQKGAEKNQDHQVLQRSLVDFDQSTVETAVSLLKTDSLYRSEKVLGVAEWFLKLKQDLKAAKTKEKRLNLVWKAVGTAPTGFTHVRSSMIGTLLEDIQSGMNFQQVSKRFAEKMDPTKYMRPQAAPSAGNIKQAESIFQKLEAAGALNRRFATIDDLQLFWRPSILKSRQTPKNQIGVFGHLNPTQNKTNVQVPPKTMTFDKFSRTVLSAAAKIEMFVPLGQNESFSGLLTAVDLSSPPILQWDYEDERNPVSWYLYTHGSDAKSWNLMPGSWTEVNGLSVTPAHWGSRPVKNQTEAVFVILKGCRDTRNPGLGLFPEILKSDFHSIRSTIEAHSKTRRVSGSSLTSAAGLKLTNRNCTARFRVTDSNGVAIEYSIDRWD